jgi:AcrR family transcriptional regulator
MTQTLERRIATRKPSIRRRPARDCALDAARDILARDGYMRLTMERVAAESRVAKTTVYRHWPTKAALCMDLYLEVAGQELHDPDTGDVAADLEYIVNKVVQVQTRTIAGAAFRGLIAEAQIDPGAAAAVLSAFAQRRREITRRVLQRAIERQQVRRDVDVDLVIDALGGATTFRLLQGHAPLNHRFAQDIVALVLDGVR